MIQNYIAVSLKTAELKGRILKKLESIRSTSMLNKVETISTTSSVRIVYTTPSGQQACLRSTCKSLRALRDLERLTESVLIASGVCTWGTD